MATFAGVAAETDCCGNLYPLHVPLASQRAAGQRMRRLLRRGAIVGLRPGCVD